MSNQTLAEKLQAEFLPQDIEWRVQQSGIKNGKPWAMVLAYVTNRAIQQRLDDVFEPQGWGNVYSPGPNGGIVCGISAMGATKWDGAENTDIESVKGGLSNSMKRAAVQWGIGRYLYKLPTVFAECTTDRPANRDEWHQGKAKDKQSNKDVYFYWRTPDLPPWALPKTIK
jgi:hypothetical protein